LNTNPQGGNSPANNEKNEDGKTSNHPPKRPVKYTLAPLVEDGRNCLVCHDVTGIESVVLETVEFYYCGSPWQRIVRASDDVFALVETGIIKWPPLERISAARFKIRLKGEQRTRSLTVRPSTRPVGTTDVGRLILDEWLVKRKFAQVQRDESKFVE
jgi:hypothetical protein